MFPGELVVREAIHSFKYLLGIYLLKLLWEVASNSHGDRQESHSHGATQTLGLGIKPLFPLAHLDLDNKISISS